MAGADKSRKQRKQPAATRPTKPKAKAKPTKAELSERERKAKAKKKAVRAIPVTPKRRTTATKPDTARKRGASATRTISKPRKVRGATSPTPRKSTPVKPAKPTPRKAPAAKPKKPTKRELALAAQKALAAKARAAKARRDAKRAAAAAEEAKRLARLERRRLQQRQRRRVGKRPVDEYEAGRAWLERIALRVGEVFPVTLQMTEAGGGHADLEGGDARLEQRTPWLIVGRFDPQEEIGYVQLAEAIDTVANDVILETAINSQRLAQIRVVFADAESDRSEGDSVISKIGAWEFILSDLIQELVGTSLTDPDEESLAARYAATRVPVFYIFFSSQLTNYNAAAPWMRTQSIKV